MFPKSLATLSLEEDTMAVMDIVLNTPAAEDEDTLLHGMARDFYDATKLNLVERWVPVGDWLHRRGRAGLEPYQKSADGKIQPEVRGNLRDGTPPRANIDYMRERLVANGFRIMGEPSAIIPVVIGDSGKSRRMTHRMMREGAIVNLVESPAVARNQSRWRLQVMAGHTRQHIDTFILKARQTVDAFEPVTA